MKIYCICIAVFVSVASGCSTVSQQPAQRASPQRESREKTVILADGVDKGEAEIIAKRFYRGRYGEGEGGAYFVGETGTHWLFDIVTGVAGAVEGRIYVNKTSGVVSFEPK